jgi:hypothetical protein
MRVETATRAWVPVFSRILRSTWGRFHHQMYQPEPRRDAAHTIAVAIEVSHGEQTMRMAIATRDAYRVTADIVALGVERILAAPPRRRGVLCPSEIVDPVAALVELERRGAIRVLREAMQRASSAPTEAARAPGHRRACPSP